MGAADVIAFVGRSSISACQGLTPAPGPCSAPSEVTYMVLWPDSRARLALPEKRALAFTRIPPRPASRKCSAKPCVLHRV
jgi:hypothetical protein